MRPTAQTKHTWRRRLLAVAATAMLALGTAMPTAAIADVIDDFVAKAPEHTMTPTDTLVDNGDGTYDVTLSVTGATEENETPKPIDIIYVVDTSLSMSNGINGIGSASRVKASRDAIAAAATKLLTTRNGALPENQQVQMAVITFGRKAEVKQGFTTNSAAVASAVPSSVHTDPGNNAGTNWEAALAKANELSSGRDGAEKYIVFLSDSNPTLRMSPAGYDGILPDGRNPDGTYGSMVDDAYGRNYSSALLEAQNRGNASLHIVSLAKDAGKMNDLANDTGSEFVDGTLPSNLTAAVGQINTTTKKTAGYKNVELVDQLSDYAEFVTAEDGSVGNLRYTKGGANWAEAPAATIEGSKLTWSLGNNALENGVTYSVTFTIRPSAQALAEVAASGQAQNFAVNATNGALVNYTTVVMTDGVEAASTPQTSAFAESPMFKVAAPDPVNVALTATKVLNGASLSGGEFTFELMNNDDLMSQATNDADGKVTFRELALRRTGSYTFIIREAAGNVEGMTYDTANHTVKVMVTVNDQGELEVSVEGNNPTFTNTYVAPADKPADSNKPGSSDASTGDNKQIPQTGDTNNAMLPIMFAAAAAACIVIGVALSRKK